MFTLMVYMNYIHNINLYINVSLPLSLIAKQKLISACLCAKIYCQYNKMEEKQESLYNYTSY